MYPIYFTSIDFLQANPTRNYKKRSSEAPKARPLRCRPTARRGREVRAAEVNQVRWGPLAAAVVSLERKAAAALWAAAPLVW
jgi:hypothetical protein